MRTVSLTPPPSESEMAADEVNQSIDGASTAAMSDINS